LHDACVTLHHACVTKDCNPSRRPSTLVPIRAGCVRSRTRGEVGMPRNTLSLVIAVLVIILLIVLILQFV
jgi:hypothetical protein